MIWSLVVASLSLLATSQVTMPPISRGPSSRRLARITWYVNPNSAAHLATARAALCRN